MPDLIEKRPLGEIERGDLVVFKHPREPERDYIKRVVGLPNDTVEVRGGYVYVNGDLTLDEARANAGAFRFDAGTVSTPSFTGVRSVDLDLATLVDYIDWTPFFHTWELAGKYPKILDDDIVGEHARQLFDDARAMLEKIVDEKWLSARAVIGFFPANSFDDDILVAPNLLIGGTDARYFHAVSPNVYRFIMVRATPDTMNIVHGIDERIAVEDYLTAIRFYYALIRKATG